MCFYLCVGDVLKDLMGSPVSKIDDNDDSETSVLFNRTTTTTLSIDLDTESSPLSLLELCSRAVGKHCTCAAIESHNANHNQPLDEPLLCQVVEFCLFYFIYVWTLDSCICRPAESHASSLFFEI